MQRKMMKREVVMMFVMMLMMSSVGCAVGEEPQSVDKTNKQTNEQAIISLGLRSSSSHNSQPWRIRVNSDQSYTILSVKERWLPKVDPTNREMMLSFGALIENLNLSAKAYGYDFSFNVTAQKATDREIGNFTLVQGSGFKDLRSINILKSIYNEKSGYQKGALDPNLMSSLFYSAGLKKSAFYYNPKTPEYKWLKKGSVAANHQQAWREDVQNELANFFCYSLDDEKRGIGLTPKMLRFPGFMQRSWYKNSSKASVMKGSFRNATKGVVKRQIANSSGFIVLTNNDNSVPELILCGRSYQRLLFEARSRHIEMQPISQILEEDPWRGEIQQRLGLGKPVQFIIRVGFLKGAKPDYNVDAVSSASIRMAPKYSVQK